MIKKLDATLFHIYEGETKHHGSNQYWFRKKLHGISGCGPATSALILSYMAQAFPAECGALYEYNKPVIKEDFVCFMQEVREYVKPGLGGLTNHEFFAKTTVEFAKTKGVALRKQNVSTSLSRGIAFGFIKKAIEEGYMPALLILRNPEPEISDFSWHWMCITGYNDIKRTIFISTYGEEYELSFEKVWNQSKPYSTNCVYFFPV